MTPNEQKAYEEELIEKLAAIEHERWADWQKWVHKRLEKNADDNFYRLDEDDFERWERQINTPYSELSENEKESDREQVRRYFPLISQARADERRRIGEMVKGMRTPMIDYGSFQTLSDILQALEDGKNKTHE